MLPAFSNYYKLIVIKTYTAGIQRGTQIDRTDSVETDPYVYGQPTSDKGEKLI